MAIKKLDHVNFITEDMPATIAFYTNTVGLIHGERMVGADEGMEYFYIPGHTHSVLHVADVNKGGKSPAFHRLAKVPSAKDTLSTGTIDHFCLLQDLADYEAVIAKLNTQKVIYETYCHPGDKLKQIWIIDPSGLRVELNFAA